MPGFSMEKMPTLVVNFLVNFLRVHLQKQYLLITLLKNLLTIFKWTQIDR